MSRKIDKNTLLSDQEIIEGILNDQSNALEVLYKYYYPMVLKLVINNNGTEDDAKDLYQEAVIIVYHKIREQGLALTSKLKTYLYAICRRLWLKKLQQFDKFRTSSIYDYEELLPIQEDEIENHQLKDQIFQQMGQALRQLGEPCKTLIEDFYINGLSMQELSEQFGYTNADNAKNQKYKCLQRLKKIFFALNK